MRIDYFTRDVIDNSENVVNVAAFGENDGVLYTVIVNLMDNDMYVLDCNGKLVEDTSLRIENGRFVGELQSYI